MTVQVLIYEYEYMPKSEFSPESSEHDWKMLLGGLTTYRCMGQKVTVETYNRPEKV